MASHKNNDDLETLSEINVVPLVDIILVVLIIFMVTAPVIMKQGMTVDLPKSSTGDTTEKKNFSVYLTGAGIIYVEKKEVNLPELLGLAQAAVVQNPLIQAVISADQLAAHGRVVEVMDMVKKAGVKKFAISIDKQK